PGEASRQERRKCFRRDLPAQRRSLAIRELWSAREIDAETRSHAINAPLQQDSCQLFAPERQIVRPFEHQRLARDSRVERLDQRQSGSERQRLWRGIRRLQMDKGAAVEIAAGAD